MPVLQRGYPSVFLKSLYVDKIAGYSDIAVKDGKLYILYEQRWGSDGLHFKIIE